MEQSVLNDQDRRWVDAIVKLTILTYQGKLKWKDVTNPSIEQIKKRYIASMSLQGFEMQVANYPKKSLDDIELTVKQNARAIKVFKTCTIITALLDAVQSMAEDARVKEEAALKAIESA